MARFTKQSLVDMYKAKNPNIDMADDAIFYNIMKSNPSLKNQVDNYEAEISKSYIDYLPRFIKEGYNRSLTGTADELMNGKKRFDMSNYNPVSYTHLTLPTKA